MDGILKKYPKPVPRASFVTPQSGRQQQFGGSAANNLQRVAGNSSVSSLVSGGISRAEFIVSTIPEVSQECTQFFLQNPAQSDAVTGTLVHAQLRKWFAQNYGPPLDLQFEAGSKALLKDRPYTVGGGPGYPDLAYYSSYFRVIEIAETKPANSQQFKEGVEDLNHYIEIGKQDERLHRQYGATSLLPMDPWKFPLPAFLDVLDQHLRPRRFQVLWCMPGIILYKEVTKKEDQEEKKSRAEEKAFREGTQQKEEFGGKKAKSPARTAHIEPGTTPGSRVLVFNEEVSATEAAIYVWGRAEYEKYLISERSERGTSEKSAAFTLATLDPPSALAMRPSLQDEFFRAGWGTRTAPELPRWVPAELRAAYQSRAIPPGISVGNWNYTWPGGFVAPIAVSRHADWIDIQALYPQELEFYQSFAARVGESETFARQLHHVCVEWNRDLLSLLDEKGSERYASIDDARARLRAINQDIHRAFLTGLAVAFAGAGGIGKAPAEPSAIAASRGAVVTSRVARDLADEIIEGLQKLLSRSKVPKGAGVP